ncbi:hypothetical protein [Aliikangiella maris]|uniref:Fibronectin type III domain-containing protein n=2 Tax=Aliikangiella maris TaxID=3162458 RepID=A0ABV3MT47_9GAMM
MSPNPPPECPPPNLEPPAPVHSFTLPALKRSTDGQFQIGWKYTGSVQIMGYQAEQSKDGGTYTRLNLTNNPNSTGEVVPINPANITVTANGKYRYRVRACRSTANVGWVCGDWAETEIITVTLRPSTPLAPTASYTAASDVTINWSAATYATY